ncbi:MAG: hypothetical protein L3K26_05315 [Candidatus Hydrogenedentes bacterium]|nr:hypothetical protein [Candidatus Hydrogenedentota bacterium]
MSKKELDKMEKEIGEIKKQLARIGAMRPGSLTRQYRNPAEKTGAYHQLSYMHKMKSRTEYVRPQFVEQTRKQVVAYKRFKKLTQRWVDLGIAHAKLTLEIAKKEMVK